VHPMLNGPAQPRQMPGLRDFAEEGCASNQARSQATLRKANVPGRFFKPTMRE